MGVDPDGDHGLLPVAGDGEPPDGQPDLKSDHASVEPRRGRATAGGTLWMSQPRKVARSVRANRPSPWARYGLQTQRPDPHPTSQKRQVRQPHRHAGIMSDQRSPLVSDPGPTSGTPHGPDPDPVEAVEAVEESAVPAYRRSR